MWGVGASARGGPSSARDWLACLRYLTPAFGLRRAHLEGCGLPGWAGRGTVGQHWIDGWPPKAGHPSSSESGSGGMRRGLAMTLSADV